MSDQPSIAFSASCAECYRKTLRIAELEAQLLCPVCLGKPINDKPCICGGSSNILGAYGGMATVAATEQMENDDLRKQLAALQWSLGVKK